MNLVLGDVVETIYIIDEDDEDDDIKVRTIIPSPPFPSSSLFSLTVVPYLRSL